MPHFMRDVHAITCAYFEGRVFSSPYTLTAHLRHSERAIAQLLQEEFAEAVVRITQLSTKIKVTAYRDTSCKDGYQIIFKVVGRDSLYLRHLDSRSVCDFAFTGLPVMD